MSDIFNIQNPNEKDNFIEGYVSSRSSDEEESALNSGHKMRQKQKKDRIFLPSLNVATIVSTNNEIPSQEQPPRGGSSEKTHKLKPPKHKPPRPAGSKENISKNFLYETAERFDAPGKLYSPRKLESLRDKMLISPTSSSRSEYTAAYYRPISDKQTDDNETDTARGSNSKYAVFPSRGSLNQDLEISETEENYLCCATSSNEIFKEVLLIINRVLDTCLFTNWILVLLSLVSYCSNTFHYYLVLQNLQSFNLDTDTFNLLTFIVAPLTATGLYPICISFSDVSKANNGMSHSTLIRRESVRRNLLLSVALLVCFSMFMEITGLFVDFTAYADSPNQPLLTTNRSFVSNEFTSSYSSSSSVLMASLSSTDDLMSNYVRKQASLRSGNFNMYWNGFFFVVTSLSLNFIPLICKTCAIESGPTQKQYEIQSSLGIARATGTAIALGFFDLLNLKGLHISSQQYLVVLSKEFAGLIIIFVFFTSIPLYFWNEGNNIITEIENSENQEATFNTFTLPTGQIELQATTAERLVPDIVVARGSEANYSSDFFTTFWNALVNIISVFHSAPVQILRAALVHVCTSVSWLLICFMVPLWFERFLLAKHTENDSLQVLGSFVSFHTDKNKPQSNQATSLRIFQAIMSLTLLLSIFFQTLNPYLLKKFGLKHTWFACHLVLALVFSAILFIQKYTVGIISMLGFAFPIGCYLSLPWIYFSACRDQVDSKVGLYSYVFAIAEEVVKPLVLLLEVLVNCESVDKEPWILYTGGIFAIIGIFFLFPMTDPLVNSNTDQR